MPPTLQTVRIKLHQRKAKRYEQEHKGQTSLLVKEVNHNNSGLQTIPLSGWSKRPFKGYAQGLFLYKRSKFLKILDSFAFIVT